MVRLKPVTKENIEDVLKLSVSKEQKDFVISTAESLAKAYVYPDTAYPFGVYDENTLVGFIMMGFYEVKGYYTLWEFMIDHKYQNKGYGRVALKLGMEYIWDKFGPVDIYTGVAYKNSVAKRLYESVGFSCTGLIECEMEEMRYHKETDSNNAKHVVVLPYDRKWAKDFTHIRDEIGQALGDLALQIEHVGSTSVEGLSAKPIIDIDIVIKDHSVFDEVLSGLEKIGYRHEGNLGIEGREAFKYEGDKSLKKHHLYVCEINSRELKRHMAFRDYLRSHPKAVKEYSRIKEEGAKLYPYDIDKYIEYKSSFIENIYSKIGISD